MLFGWLAFIAMPVRGHCGEEEAGDRVDGRGTVRTRPKGAAIHPARGPVRKLYLFFVFFVLFFCFSLEREAQVGFVSM